ncbi:hypothetical protein BRARA_I05470 [Brassica rapa]|uniref:Uncharacterized protein n=1 Tax=Brassica campestris TaxID=3711 RepID=A0A397Y5X1_BRACM|nr:hypothetical protein BRARA_I05470 [Brassica rapa]CAG7867553.1 unnamed protein product [Brassica rapa]VDC64482.1 unnamed protein product [Brassica rapa]
MNPGRLLCFIGFIFLVVSSKASRIHVERQRFSSKPLSSQERGFLPSQPTLPVIGAGEKLPEKRKVKTGSNPLHNKR